MAPLFARSGSMSRSSSKTGHHPLPEDLKLEHMDLSHKKEVSGLPPPAPMRSVAKPPTHAAFDPSKAFVRQLATKSDYRRHLATLLKEHALVEGGDLQVATWIKDEGFDTTISSVMQALESAKSSDLLFWATRYNLFVLWSADRSHPWDGMPGAASHTTLEIGKLRGTEREVIVLLNGKPVHDYTFSSGVFKTTAPVEWDTPNGKTALVNLELQLSAFFGYGKDADDTYLGLQCHGVLWPSPEAETPAHWPIAPPIVAGKVNIAGRAAAVSPGSADSLAAFAGVYASHQLPEAAGKPAEPGFELTITVNPQGRPALTVDGRALTGWSFDANNVLAWEDEAGYAAWLQFMVLPGGPVFMGALRLADDPDAPVGFNIFGELRSQPSRLAPDGAMDPAVGQLVAAGLASAATLLTASLLRAALKCWGQLKSGMSADEIAATHEVLLERMDAEFATLKRLEAVGAAAEATFVGAAGGAKEIAPEATGDASAAETEAADNAHSAKQAADATEAAAAEAEEAAADGNALEATSKAAVAAWRASQAQAAAAAAETSALEAASHASTAHTIAALAAAQAAAQSFNLAKEVAGESAAAEQRAASAALRAVEAGIALYAERRDYLKLKDIAEASDVAGKALDAAKSAVAGWEAGSVASRRAALDAAKVAAEFSQLCHKFMRSVHRT